MTAEIKFCIPTVQLLLKSKKSWQISKNGIQDFGKVDFETFHSMKSMELAIIVQN